MLLRPAIEDDIPALLALERLAEAQRYVGQWSEERHRTTLRGGDARYYVSEDPGGTLSCYAILRGLAEDSGSIELKRIVVAEPGQGLGRRILAEILRIVFDELRAHRLFLDVYDDNLRAQHVYRGLGFKQEGTMRDAASRDGKWHDLLLMSILAPEYAAHQPRAEG